MNPEDYLSTIMFGILDHQVVSPYSNSTTFVCNQHIMKTDANDFTTEGAIQAYIFPSPHKSQSGWARPLFYTILLIIFFQNADRVSTLFAEAQLSLKPYLFLSL